MFATITRLSVEIRSLLIGYFVCRAFYFATWPFVAIILVREFGFSASGVGALYCITGLLATVLGMYAGRLSDLFSRKTTVLFGLVCYACAFLCFGLMQNLWGIYTGVTFVALGKSIYEPQSRALISDRIKDSNIKEKVFYLLQYILNMAAAIGPLAFASFGLDANLSAFTITGVAFLVFTAVMAMLLSEAVIRTPSRELPKTSVKEQTVFADRSFLIFVTACFLMLMPYAQFESVFSVHLETLFAGTGSKLFAKAIGINAATILICQPLLERLLRKLSINLRLLVGAIPYFSAFWVFSLVDQSNINILYVASFVFGVGESVLFPVLQVKLDRISPEESKGAYYSVYHSAWLAFSFGPLLWGVVMDFLGGRQTLLIGCLFLLPAFACYLFSEYLRNGQAVEDSMAAIR